MPDPSSDPTGVLRLVESWQASGEADHPSAGPEPGGSR